MLWFTFFGIPVGVHFTFLFIALIVGARGNRTEFAASAAVAAVLIAILVAVLVHEAGHALTARYYGADDITITLFALGGVTTFSNDPPLSPGKRFVITAAGSGAGIVAGGAALLLAVAGVFEGMSELFKFSGQWFIIAALGWGVLNWVPIRPLDGGQMLTAALEIVAPHRGENIARIVSGVVGAALVAVAFAIGNPLMGLYVAFIALVGLRRQDRPDEATSYGSGDANDEQNHAGERTRETPPEFPI